MAIQIAFIIVQTIYTLTKITLSEGVIFGINVFLTIYAFAGLGFVWVLLGFHLYLAYVNTTTNEYCKNVWDSLQGNPFSK